jgi:rhodanese-related sulfurtransferase
VQALLTLGAAAIDTRSQTLYDAGHLPGAEHVGAAAILLYPAAFLSGRSPTAPLVIYGAGTPDATLRQVATEIEGQAGGPRIYLYTGGYADWSAP